MSALLAPDPAVPQRDALLDERDAHRRALLGGRGRGCERVNAKYRVGDSLRVVYRLEAGGASHTVAGRTFAGPQRAASTARAVGDGAAAGRLPAVLARAGARDRVLDVPERPPARRPAAARPALGALDRLVGHAGRPHAAGGLRARARGDRRSASTPAAACSPT